jgi:uncharacterized membrane protein (DUF4010 family)
MAPALALAIWPAFIAPTVIGLALMWTGLRTGHAPTGSGKDEKERADDNPLQIRAALQMALMFQVVLFVVGYAQSRFGATGLTGSAALLGTLDVDALTMSMARMTSTGATAAKGAAAALTLGIIVNALVKLGIALVVGRGRFRPVAGMGLAAIAAALGVYLYISSGQRS